MFKQLEQPYPTITNNRYRLLVSLAFGVFIALFLLVFTPFGLSGFDDRRLLISCAVFGIITTTLIFICSWALPRLWPGTFGEENNTVGAEIGMLLITIFIIGLGNQLFAHFYLHASFSIISILWYQMATLVVSVLPLTILVMRSQLRLQKKYAAAANMLNTAVQGWPENGSATSDSNLPEQNIRIAAEQTKDDLLLRAGELIYIVAADNYIRVYYRLGNKVQSVVLRSTLKKAAAGLQAYPHFLRCHRTYLVNMDKVIHVSGNAQGYKLHLGDVSEEIPVSRHLNKTITALLMKSKSVINNP
ncbi:LytTR family transcriptional regulator [Chitinophaga niastensis]|uniref:LytTR family transcriptional regulator n=1 Tax=Chitinophaga niastensis TaxID=536980 RepID=A0A2P8HGL7_CHINA|nr:LytTR family DNA-binding domain-containing protein [Chitinophaga niastensis]PSL45340.1 LytTR family transcriptional regulator [Chitinophaga niastensis]